jgi:hypothetical protein
MHTCAKPRAGCTAASTDLQVLKWKLMRWFLGVLFVCAIPTFGQTPVDPEIERAEAGIEKLRALAEAGAIPRAQLQKAEDQLADARDAAILRKTIYGQDLTDEQADDMLAAATRRFERRERAFDDAKKLVDAGVASQASLGTFMEELDSARKECELASSRAKLTREIAEMAKAEDALQSASAGPEHSVAERFDGDGSFSTDTFNRVEKAFEFKFGKAMPVSAMGETAVHRSLGFDHRGRVDVALPPDQPEGVWLREYLAEHNIPYFAFRQAVPGKATGAHIHLGPMSTRLKLGG